MAAMDERMAQVEVKVDTFRDDVSELKAMIAALQADLRGTTTALQADLRGTTAAFQADLRGTTAALQADLKGTTAALQADLKGTATELRGMIATLDQKMDRHFLWVVGIQFTTLLAIVAGLFGLLRQLL